MLLHTPPDKLTGDWHYRALDESGHVVAEGNLEIRQALRIELRTLHYTNYTHIGTRSVTQRDDQHGPHSEQNHPQYLRNLVKQFEELKNNEHFRNAKPDRLLASLKGNAFRADLNAGWNDDNIWLEGQMKNGRIEGTWKWATFAGFRAQGRFVMTPLGVREALRAFPFAAKPRRVPRAIQSAKPLAHSQKVR